MPLVRDEAQGFYTGENRHSSGRVIRTMEFSREVTEKILRFAVDRAGEVWPGEGTARVLMAYKFHLLDGALDDWVAAFRYRHGIDARLFQPDTVNRNMITHGLVDRTVIVAGNEWADIMHVVLLDRFGSERQENRCTENVYLHPDLNGLVEYQTVHGSADDLEGTDTVNPTATVRAAALIAERHAGCAGAVAAVETALAAVLDGLEPDAVRSKAVYTAARVRIGVDLLALFDAEPRPDTPRPHRARLDHDRPHPVRLHPPPRPRPAPRTRRRPGRQPLGRLPQARACPRAYDSA